MRDFVNSSMFLFIKDLLEKGDEPSSTELYKILHKGAKLSSGDAEARIKVIYGGAKHLYKKGTLPIEVDRRIFYKIAKKAYKILAKIAKWSIKPIVIR